jgi:hypothetical protein
VDPLKEQTAPEIDVVQLLVGVNSPGTVRPIERRFGTAAAIVKGEVIVMVIVDVDSSTKKLDGV